MKPKIVVVEDEPKLIGILEYLLEDEGYEVHSSQRGDTALAIIEEHKPDLVLLDIMLPGIDGFELCAAIRRLTTTPVIVLTARKEQEDVIRGLELGADDYLTKPFNNKELTLRIRRVLGRTGLGDSFDQIVHGDIVVRVASREVSVAGRALALTPTEFSLLLCLMHNRGRVLSWESLLREVWGSEDWEGGKELVKVNIRRLRKKLEPDPTEPKYLLTNWGIGYRMGGVGISDSRRDGSIR
ncbi:MAG TPA: response regulator transcription factor [Spirochaetia bacterium]|nr:response regulator transcription factor [Spirochaetia bacterium]